MERRNLGESAIEVSAIALGTWAMGGTVSEWGHVDDRESLAAIHQALDCGINLIDTAPIYGLGHSEEIVGKVAQGHRNEMVIATKCGLLPPTEDGALPRRCLSGDSIVRECEASLRRLKTDVIDIYQCHWPDPETAVRETMEALVRLRQQGKIRAIGLSNYGCERIEAAREFGPIHSLQPPFSMLETRAADDLLPYCLEHNIAVLAYSPLARGLLTGKFDKESSFEDLRARDPRYMGLRFQRNLQTVESLKRIAARYEKSVGQLAINWVATYRGVTSAIVGAKRPSQVLENAGATGWSIAEKDLKEIDRLLQGVDVDT